MFGETLAALKKVKRLAPFLRLGGHALIALDGTECFCSQKRSCPRCSQRRRSNGRSEHFHQMVSAATVAGANDSIANSAGGGGWSPMLRP